MSLPWTIGSSPGTAHCFAVGCGTACRWAIGWPNGSPRETSQSAIHTPWLCWKQFWHGSIPLGHRRCRRHPLPHHPKNDNHHHHHHHHSHRSSMTPFLSSSSSCSSYPLFLLVAPNPLAFVLRTLGQPHPTSERPPAGTIFKMTAWWRANWARRQSRKFCTPAMIKWSACECKGCLSHIDLIAFWNVSIETSEKDRESHYFALSFHALKAPYPRLSWMMAP